MPHGVEGEEVVFTNAVVFAQEFEAGFEDAGFGVLKGDADTEHGPAVVMVEINTFRDFATGDAEEDCTSAVAACCAVGLQGEGCFLAVGRFDQY